MQSTNPSHGTDLNEDQPIGEVFVNTKVTAPPYITRNKVQKSERIKREIDLNLFEGMVPESMDKMPWDANGNSIYLVPTTEEYWHDKQLDGRH